MIRTQSRVRVRVRVIYLNQTGILVINASYANLLEQKKIFVFEKGSNLRGLVWYNNKADVTLTL